MAATRSDSEPPSPPGGEGRGEGAPLDATAFRRQLRRHATPAEAAMWACRRNRQLAGFKFRRQVGIGPYVVDFCCRRPLIVVELDGRIHDDPARAASDFRRQQHLEAQGYRVVRFANDEVVRQRDVVLAAIEAALRHAPSP